MVQGNRKTVIILLGLLSLVFLIVLIWPSAPQHSVWQATTHAYKTHCDDCKVVTQVNPGHRGASLTLVYDPTTDDAIAQWGDCLESVMACRRESHTSLDQCVIASRCPVACIEQYQLTLGSSSEPQQIKQIFKQIFLNDGGLCVPEDKG